MKLLTNRSYFMDIAVINRLPASALIIPANWNQDTAAFLR
jgi:hypothetical protein